MENLALSASLPVQVALGAGYLGYLAAYSGVRAHHKQTDTAFLTLAFGLFATLLFNLLEPYIGVTFAVLASVVLAVALGLGWRKKGRHIVNARLRKWKFTFADDDPTVLTTIAADTEYNVSQVLVVLDDGKEMLCQDTHHFADAAIRPLIIGGDGSVGMYVTHTYRRDKEGKQIERKETGVRDPQWGDNMTIIPAAKIQQIDLRFQKKLSPPSSEAAGSVVRPVPVESNSSPGSAPWGLG